MNRKLLLVTALSAFLFAGPRPAAAQSSVSAPATLQGSGAPPVTVQNRYIVVTKSGLGSVLHLCALLGCQVQGSLDGTLGLTYLVNSNGILSPVVNLLESLLGIVSIEPDQVLTLPQPAQPGVPTGLSDTAPVNYYGSIVWHGYVAQPAAQIVRLVDAQSSFGLTGTGIVAVIDTGVDPNHPALAPVLLQGYDFTRNQPGASEWLDVTGTQNGVVDTNAQDQQPVMVQQSTAAVLDQSTAAVLDGQPYSDFGHGTMTTGLVHLVAPKARLLPLKAFSANGTGTLSNIIAALYYAVQNNASVVSMSFDVSAPSSALSQAAAYANKAGVILVASAGNEGTNASVYPAALDNYVMGIASTSNADVRSSFSNYGPVDVWIAAPGESVISTYPGGTYASSSGTSFSCPLVSGTADLLLQARGGLNQSTAAGALSHAQRLTPDLNHGRLDIYQAVLSRLSSW
ncbi:MAG TPA: S8 family serine peptidase [Candidatus Binatia bacterium]|nr:S8 family serine peptidase [Candidatus Binatia bacterium]